MYEIIFSTFSYSSQRSFTCLCQNLVLTGFCRWEKEGEFPCHSTGLEAAIFLPLNNAVVNCIFSLFFFLMLLFPDLCAWVSWLLTTFLTSLCLHSFPYASHLLIYLFIYCESYFILPQHLHFVLWMCSSKLGREIFYWAGKYFLPPAEVVP